MDTAIPIDLTPDTLGANRALLRLITWLSPSFPVGAFSYSHGIEYAVEAELVTDAESLAGWVGAVLARGAGKLDGAFFRLAHEAMRTGEDTALYDAVIRADAMRGTSEMARESAAQGTAFLETLRRVWPNARLDALARFATDEKRPVAYAVAVGAAAAVHDIPMRPALAAFLHAAAANLVSAGVRLVPLGQTDGQRVLAALEPVILEAVEATLSRPFDDIGIASPVIDWASMQHETQYTRLFRS